MRDIEDIGNIEFGGALQVAVVFKVLAVLTVVGGVIVGIAGAVELGNSESDNVTSYLATVTATTVTSASVLAFFGYVLEILVKMYTHVWNIRYGSDGDEEGTA